MAPSKALAFVALFLSACATGERMGDVHAGMTKDQVTTLLGRPDGYSQSGSTEALTYSNRLMSGFSWDRADITLSSRAVL